jgi:hypothetical protein
VRAAPEVSCAKANKKTHMSIQVQRKQSGLPCAMALQLISCSPRRDQGLFVTVALRMLEHKPGRADAPLQDLTRLPLGRQDHTTSPYAIARSSCAPVVAHSSQEPPCKTLRARATASIASHRAFRDDREPPLVRVRRA